MRSFPPLYPITDATLPVPLSAQIRRLGEAGFPLVQFRGKPLDAPAQWSELRTALAEAASQGGWPLICVNDRADLAQLAAQEGLAPWGLHLGQDDLPPQDALKLPGLQGCHVGTSTHDSSEWERVDDACDHAGVGPFRGTTTKSDHAEPIGLEGLRAGCAALRAKGVVPIAIGGLTFADASACFEAGAESLAMVSEIHRTANPAQMGWEVQRARWRTRPPYQRGQGLAIVGGSGAGKTSLGRELALHLSMPFRDLDEAIEAKTGRTVGAIFADSGEGAFRALESTQLPSLLATPAVVALGGGAWESQANRDLVRSAGFTPLWLAETPAKAWERVKGHPHRPLAQDRHAFMTRWNLRTRAWSEAPMILPFGHDSRALAIALLDW